MKSWFSRQLMTVVLVVALLPLTAQAAEDDAGNSDAAPGEIIVTAQKREQRWLDVPIAITVTNAEELQARRATSGYDALRQVPGVSGANPSDELTQVSIRGVSTEDYGIGSDPAVGVFFDGVYLGRNENTAVNFIDLERVEIARGPQGEVFGRATPGGAISLVPRRPGPDNEFEAGFELGNIATVRAQLVGNIPLADNLFLRGNLFYDRHGNFVDNVTLDEELGAERAITGRLALRYQPGDASTIDLTGWYERFDGDPWLYRNFAETVPDGETATDKLSYTREIFSDLSARDQEETRRNWGVILRGEHKFDNEYQLVTTSSAIGFDADYLDDFDGTDLFLYTYGQYGKQSLLTQELRIQSPSSAPVRWFAGALAYRERIDTTIVQSYGDYDLCLFYEFGDEDYCAPAGDGVTDTLIFATAKNDGFALYAEGEADIGKSLTVTAGLRYTRDRKRFTINAPTPGGFLPAEDVGYTTPTDGLDVLRQQTFESVQPRIALTWRPSRELSLYALVAEGEKPGGFDTFDAYSPSFDAEMVRSYEAGIKGRLLRNRLTFSLAAYHYDYTDLQVLVADGPRDIVKNAASASGRGIEAEASYTLPWGSVELRGSVNDTHFKRFIDGTDDFSGNRLPYTPKYAVGASVSVAQPVGGDWEAFGRIDADYQPAQYLTPDNEEFSSQPGYATVDFRLGVRRGKMEVYAFGQNVTNARYVAYADTTDYAKNFGGYLAQVSTPVVFGVGVSFRL
jgi:iron complex outermembrane recepter protein